MNSLVDLSVKQLRRAIAIKSRIARLESELSGLLGGIFSGRTAGGRGRRAGLAAAGRPRLDGRRRKRSAAWRAKLAASARARWKKAKAAGRTTL